MLMSSIVNIICCYKYFWTDSLLCFHEKNSYVIKIFCAKVFSLLHFLAKIHISFQEFSLLKQQAQDIVWKFILLW